MADTSNAHVDFINMCPTSACSTWVQSGVYQGTAPNSFSPTLMHIYRENLNTCLGYSQSDHGQPPSPNYPFYVYYSGISETVDGCTGQRRYYFKVGSINNPPIGSGWLTTSSGVPQAALEVIGGEEINVDRFGLDNSGNVNASYGLHLLNTSSNWVLWNSTNAPGTTTFDDSPNVYQGVASWYSFKAHD